jgi:hypothetical protein
VVLLRPQARALHRLGQRCPTLCGDDDDDDDDDDGGDDGDDDDDYDDDDDDGDDDDDDDAFLPTEFLETWFSYARKPELFIDSDNGVLHYVLAARLPGYNHECDYQMTDLGAQIRPCLDKWLKPEVRRWGG